MSNDNKPALATDQQIQEMVHASCAALVASLLLSGWTERAIGVGEAKPLRALLHPKHTEDQNQHWAKIGEAEIPLNMNQSLEECANECEHARLRYLLSAADSAFVSAPIPAFNGRQARMSFRIGYILPAPPADGARL